MCGNLKADSSNNTVTTNAQTFPPIFYPIVNNHYFNYFVICVNDVKCLKVYYYMPVHLK